jgi:hypothetical protein
MKCNYCSRKVGKVAAWKNTKPYHCDCWVREKNDDFWRRMKARGRKSGRIV